MQKWSGQKKTYPIANENLDVPEKTLLRYALKEYKDYVGKLLSEIDDLQYKNRVLVEKGKSLEKELNRIKETFCLTKSENKEIRRAIRKEEMYKTLVEQNKILGLKNKKLVEEKNYLICKLMMLQTS